MTSRAAERDSKDGGDVSSITVNAGSLLRGCEMIHPGCTFLCHVEDWRAQKVPLAVAERGPGRALIVRYTGGGIGEGGPNVVSSRTSTCSSDDEQEWPFDTSLSARSD